MLNVIKNLKSAGVLGINARNREFVMAHNPRHAFPLVDNKLQSKRIAQAENIAVPKLYGTISTCLLYTSDAADE